MNNNYIGTYTNKKFFFLNPEVDQVCIEDIAHALSMTCRYSGHVKRFYSVAEHSIVVARLVWSKTNCSKQALSALLHDASEAYLTDIPRPLKPFINGYGEMELAIEKVIQAKFNIEPMNKLIKHIDHNVVGAEAKQLFEVTPDYADQYEHIDIDRLQGMSPGGAEYAFLSWFRLYGGVY